MPTTWSGQVKQTASANVMNSTADLSLAFGANLDSLDLMLALAAWYNSANPTITISDTLGSTWTPVGSVLHPDGSSGVRLYYSAACPGGANTVKMQSASNLCRLLNLLAVPGLANTALDTHVETTGSSTAPNSGSITPAAAGQFNFGWCYDISGASAIRASAVGWTERIFDFFAALGACVSTQDRPNFDTNSFASAFTIGNSGWACGVASFANMGPPVASGGTTVITPPRRFWLPRGQTIYRNRPFPIAAAQSVLVVSPRKVR